MFKWLKPSKAQAEPVDQAPSSGAGINARALLARVTWTSARRLDGLLQGDYRTLFRGSGMMLADLREYEPQDDVRYIDWNVTARMQTPYVRQHEEDRELAAWFVVDLSPSVDFGSSGVTKRQVAAEAIATLGHLLQQHGNRVGAIVDRGRDNVDILPARAGRTHLLHVLEHVLTAPTQSTNQMTSLSKLFTRAARLIKQRSTVFILSDFYADQGWDKSLMMLASRHDVVAVRLVDPLEQRLPDMGMLTMRDAETGEQIFIDTSDKRFRERFARQAADHEARLIKTFTRSAVDCLELGTDDAVHEGLIRFVRQRQQLMRLAAGGVRHG
ncbi:MAG: DUF58 domain-containing protein [Burkholderiaceae bacterium]|nr:DUF58 domain-containing protein [Burkholderiaceae bacterium]MCD8517167.1 DUF58 domain-containing protein [Burkholderiaceae bacterium]MCD8536433.1 DUF58 domain-containing protein [Burkholderiaceae bacterium]MCD8565287.1 DUF58 domain-containing protein [Burkholderiaceae bacterium]